MPHKTVEAKRKYDKLRRTAKAAHVSRLRRESYLNNKRSIISSQVQRHREIRLEVLRFYAGDPPECKCCGVTIVKFLTIDHMNGGGTQHRRTMTGNGIYKWLRRNDYPMNFQVLCFNCNAGKHFNGGVCPHKEL